MVTGKSADTFGLLNAKCGGQDSCDILGASYRTVCISHHCITFRAFQNLELRSMLIVSMSCRCSSLAIASVFARALYLKRATRTTATPDSAVHRVSHALRPDDW